MTEHHGDAALDERAAQLLGDLGVEAGQHLLFQLDDRDLGAEGLVEVAELETDRAGADHDHAGRQLVVDQRLLAGEHAVAGRHPAKQPFARARGDQDAIRFDCLGDGRRGLPSTWRERDGMRSADCCPGLEDSQSCFS